MAKALSRPEAYTANVVFVGDLWEERPAAWLAAVWKWKPKKKFILARLENTDYLYHRCVFACCHAGKMSSLADVSRISSIYYKKGSPEFTLVAKRPGDRGGRWARLWCSEKKFLFRADSWEYVQLWMAKISECCTQENWQVVLLSPTLEKPSSPHHSAQDGGHDGDKIPDDDDKSTDDGDKESRDESTENGDESNENQSQSNSRHSTLEDSCINPEEDPEPQGEDEDHSGNEEEEAEKEKDEDQFRTLRHALALYLASQGNPLGRHRCLMPTTPAAVGLSRPAREQMTEVLPQPRQMSEVQQEVAQITEAQSGQMRNRGTTFSPTADIPFVTDRIAAAFRSLGKAPNSGDTPPQQGQTSVELHSLAPTPHLKESISGEEEVIMETILAEYDKEPRRIGGVQPKASQISEVEPEASQMSEVEPEASQISDHEVEPEASQISEIEPEASQISEVEPEASQISEVEPEASQISEVEPEASQISEVEPEESQIFSSQPELEFIGPVVFKRSMASRRAMKRGRDRGVGSNRQEYLPASVLQDQPVEEEQPKQEQPKEEPVRKGGQQPPQPQQIGKEPWGPVGARTGVLEVWSDRLVVGAAVWQEDGKGSPAPLQLPFKDMFCLLLHRHIMVVVMCTCAEAEGGGVHSVVVGSGPTAALTLLKDIQVAVAMDTYFSWILKSSPGQLQRTDLLGPLFKEMEISDGLPDSTAMLVFSAHAQCFEQRDSEKIWLGLNLAKATYDKFREAPDYLNIARCTGGKVEGGSPKRSEDYPPRGIRWKRAKMVPISDVKLKPEAVPRPHFASPLSPSVARCLATPPVFSGAASESKKYSSIIIEAGGTDMYISLIRSTENLEEKSVEEEEEVEEWEKLEIGKHSEEEIEEERQEVWGKRVGQVDF